MNYKNEILTVAKFIENRPDLAIHTETTIQSSIYQCAGMLNSETNGMIEKVWDFNSVDPEFSKDNPLYRTPGEMSQITEAFIAQTQYNLNLGNDMTQGGGSYSIGNINSSFSRPIDRDIVAPGVYKLLQNARVYELQNFGFKSSGKEKDRYCDRYSEEPITREIGDNRYVEQLQPNVTPGHVAIVGQNQIVTFSNPFNLSFGFYDANRIKQGNSNDYATIDKVNDLAFFGENLYGFKSAMQRGEVMQMIQGIGSTGNKDFPYKKDDIVILTYVINETREVNQDGKMSHFLCLKDNTNVYPLNDTTGTWELLEIGEVDINKIVEITYDRVVEKFNIDFLEFINTMDVKGSEFEASFTKKFEDLQVDINTLFNGLEDNIKNEYIPNEIDKLPSANQVMYHKGQSYTFKDKASFDSIKVEYNIQDVDYEIVENGSRELVPNQTKPTGEKIVLPDGTTREIMCITYPNIKPLLTTINNESTFNIFPHKNVVIKHFNLIGNKLSPIIVENATPPQGDMYIDQRANVTQLHMNYTGYPVQNDGLELIVYFYYTLKSDDYVGDTSNGNTPFYTVAFLKDITKKQLTKVVEQNEIIIKDDQQTGNFDRTITLKDFANDLTQDIKVENNGVLETQIPLNYMMSENETWTGKYYRVEPTEQARKVYHFNKKIMINVPTQGVIELVCLGDVDRIMDVGFEIIIDYKTGTVAPNMGSGSIELYYDADNTGKFANFNANNITLKSINVKYTKKGDA